MKYFNVEKLYQELTDIKKLLVVNNFEPLDIDQTADLLKIKKSSLYQLIHKNQIPHYKPNGKKVYFNRTELSKWILESKVKTNEEIEGEYRKDKLSLTSNKQVVQK